MPVPAPSYRLLAILAALVTAASAPVTSGQTTAASWSAADLADVFATSPIVARARIIEARGVDAAATTTRPANTARFYIVADLTTLIRGSGGVAPRVAWLVDVPLDARGRAPKLKKRDVLIAASPVAGRPAEVRLTARDAQLDWSAATEARVRAIVAAALAPDAAPAITGVGQAFHVPGTLAGESETQVFLTTASAQPVSLTILRRPGETPRWAVALGEIVDESAAPPVRDSFGWYRLACFLPPTLPAASVTTLSGEEADAARADYAVVLAGLGSCGRTRR